MHFVSALLAVTALGSSAPPTYRTQVLEAPPDSVALQGFALGETGAAVGSFLNTGTNFFDAVLWNPDGSIAGTGATYGLVEAAMMCVEPDGTVFGSGTPETSEVSRAMVISPQGDVTLLPSLAGNDGVVSAAFGSSADGLVVGRSALIPSPFWLSVANDAVVWEKGRITSLGTLGGYWGEARDVNDDRLVIGSSNTAQSDLARGFVWDPVGGMREIQPAEPGGLGHAVRLNEHGVIVGWSTFQGEARACRWSDPDGPPELLPLPPFATDSGAQAIDDAGAIVGSVSIPSGESRAVLWLDGEVHFLEDLLEEPVPYELRGALDMNEAGQVLVSAFHPTSGFTTVLLSPVPPLLAGDPSAISLSAGGSQTLALDAGPSFAGAPYLLLGSFSGSEPGLPLGSVTLPLNVDAYLLVTLQHANQPPLSNSAGRLDAEGRATASFGLPPATDASLAGLLLHHAFGILGEGPEPLVAASNPVAVSLVP